MCGGSPTCVTKMEEVRSVLPFILRDTLYTVFNSDEQNVGYLIYNYFGEQLTNLQTLLLILKLILIAYTLYNIQIMAQTIIKTHCVSEIL